MKALVRTAASVCCAAGLFRAPPAGADTIAVLAVAEPPGPSSELAELTQKLRSIASERTQGVLDAAELRERMTGQTKATLAELDRAYTAAVATSENGDYQSAAAALQEIVAELEKLPAGREAFGHWARAMLRLARAEQALGRREEMRATLERLVRAAPEVIVDPTQYPPSLERQVAEIRAAVSALPTHRLSFRSASRGAKVFVEGREIGAAPAVVDLPAGRYRVTGVLGSVRLPAITVDLSREDQTVTLDFTTADALRPAQGPGLALPESDRQRGLLAAGTWLGVDRLIAARLASENNVNHLVGAVYDVHRGKLLREGRVRLSDRGASTGSLTALAVFLLTGQPSTLVAVAPFRPEGPAAPPSLEVRPPPVVAGTIQAPDLTTPEPSKTLGWTSFGSGVAAVGFGAFAVVQGFTARSKYTEAQGLIESDGHVKDTAQFDRLNAEGNSAKKSAYLSAGLAIATAAASAVLGYMSYKKTGEIGPFRF